MNLRSPVAAMLWENWRLSRVEALQRLVVGLLAVAVILKVNSAQGPTIAFWTLVGVHGFFYFSIAKLNGGRFMDGYKPGFPLYLLYTRPVPTAVFVGATVIYDAVSCATLYLVSVAFIGLVFGTWFPSWYMAACLVAYHLVCTCIQYATRNRIVQWVGSIASFWPVVALTRSGLDSPPTLAHYALLVLLAVGAFALTVAGVSRQRRGDAIASEPSRAAWSGYPVGLISLFRVPCPTSSATKAQLWFELKSTGFPVLTLGLAVALLILSLSALGSWIAPARAAAVGTTAFAIPLLLLIFAANAFGIRNRQGRSQASVFEMTQPRGTAQLAGLKLLVRTACVLGALLAIGLSVWISGSFLGSWNHWLPDGHNDALPGLLNLRSAIGDALAGQPRYLHAAQVVVISVAIAGLVSWQAAREALKARYPRATLVAMWLPAVWGLTVFLLVVAGSNGILPHPVMRALVFTAMWTATAVLVSATIYLSWRNITERALAAVYVAGVLAILVGFGVAYLALLRAIDVQLAGKPLAADALLSWPVLLLLLGSMLAPWSLNRVRHT
ncbi:MAG TPA: hypothetical protein VFZ95_15445 [Steroidobacteraceae bacterium]